MSPERDAVPTRGPEYSDERFVAAVAELAADPDASPTTSAVADAVGCSTSTVTRRCRALVDAGRLERCAVAPSHIWHPPETSPWEVLEE